MKYPLLIYFLFCLHSLPAQTYKQSDLVGHWTSTNYQITQWDFKDNTFVELTGIKTYNKRDKKFVHFRYYVDSTKNELRISQVYDQFLDTLFFYRIIEVKQHVIRLNLYKKIPYSLESEKPKKEIVIPNKGTMIIIQKK